MRTILLAFIILVCSFTSSGQSLPVPEVDQRIELLSIVFRLAGSPEYNNENNIGYVNAIHEHFDRFINHPLIQYTKQLRDSTAIGYDAVMSMAVSLEAPPALNPVIHFRDQLPDPRWKAAAAVKFVTLLQQFYRDADCASFFQAQASRYLLAAQRFHAMLQQFDVSWYPAFYGQSAGENFRIFIGLGNGYACYGPHLNLPNGVKNVYAIMGSSTFDAAGDPVFQQEDYLPTLIHEFNHSFVNRLNEACERQLAAAGKMIFEKERVKMHRLHYETWMTMMNEALVRAAVVIYLKNHQTGSLTVDRELKTQLAEGFVWTEQLVTLLEQYEKQRTDYPTLESFMPKMIDLYSKIAIDIDHYEGSYREKCAKVVSTSPFENGDQDVNAGTSAIIFHFDKPLDGIRYFIGPVNKQTDHYPKPLSFNFSDGNKSLIMKVELKPNTEYQVSITGSNMRTADGYSVQEYVLSFKTGAM